MLSYAFLFWTTWYPQKSDPFKLSQFGHSKKEALNNTIFYKNLGCGIYCFCLTETLNGTLVNDTFKTI